MANSETRPRSASRPTNIGMGRGRGNLGNFARGTRTPDGNEPHSSTRPKDFAPDKKCTSDNSISTLTGQRERNHSTRSPNSKNLCHWDNGIVLHKEALLHMVMHQSGELHAYDFVADDLEDLGEIGRGEYGAVYRMRHRQSLTQMAVKKLRVTMDERQQGNLKKELDVVKNSANYPHIVKFYGVLFHEGDCWICMELMSLSLDKFYRHVYNRLQQVIPEAILGKITVATVNALRYLKDEHKIIHRDVKPSNILLDKQGHIKLCDFGISGHLVDSHAKTRDVGCRPYMADASPSRESSVLYYGCTQKLPERIDPGKQDSRYDVRTDVWSLGITLFELATGRFPYPKWNSVFDQLKHVIQGPAPRLDDSRFSADFRSFVNTCLQKDEKRRPKYDRIMQHPFYLEYSRQLSQEDVAGYVRPIIASYEKQDMLGLLQCAPDGTG